MIVMRPTRLIRFPPYRAAKLSIQSNERPLSTVQRSITVAEVTERTHPNRVGRAP